MLKDIRKVYKDSLLKFSIDQEKELRERLNTIKIGLEDKLITAAKERKTSVQIFPGETYNGIPLRKDDIPNIVTLLRNEKFFVAVENFRITVMGWEG